MRFMLEIHWVRCISKFISDKTISESHFSGNRPPPCTKCIFFRSYPLKNLHFSTARAWAYIKCSGGRCTKKPPSFPLQSSTVSQRQSSSWCGGLQECDTGQMWPNNNGDLYSVIWLTLSTKNKEFLSYSHKFQEQDMYPWAFRAA